MAIEMIEKATVVLFLRELLREAACRTRFEDGYRKTQKHRLEDIQTMIEEFLTDYNCGEDWNKFVQYYQHQIEREGKANRRRVNGR
jgi:hypothetical protein